MKTRWIAAVVCTAAVGLGLAAPAQAATDRFTYISNAQCKQAHAAISAGKELPDPSLLRHQDGSSSLKGDTLHIYANSAFNDEVHRAADAWSQASGGKIKFQFHDQPGPGIVSIVQAENSIGATAVTRGQGTENPTILLSMQKQLTDPSSALYVIAHEMGHTLGLAHGCAGDLMKAGTTPGAITIKPTATDVAAVMQGKPEFA